ncbi:small-conductance mechanosensitive iron channel protein [Formosa agariphila KMM 3901]|uniref:Small-conductance mechanosensitive iron channel protein n=1 Tax=Formosa agariphila (strain DSM 15362 / KCTC 12365 / LMG 23005 / KMM 3901 / M-2Alg 35-1) TaxID=1347342 RepID=T2KPM0_FORAG|nr:mechanosensitive ion channel family protein [Formosa agariphila]CDF80695.1 small-conductance mechanosensitive iron channel protein [Formosa agariphila KMM 3901]
MKDKLLEAWSKMLSKLDHWFDSIILALPNFIIAIIVFTFVLFLSKQINKLVLKLLDRSSMQRSMKNLISKLVSAIVIIVGLFIVLGILNLDKALNTVLAGAGVLGLAVGLALQGALANFYSGVVLSYIHFFKYGDWIESNGYEGEITNIDLRSVTLKQSDNNLVYIPNKMVVDSPIKNYSTTAQSRVILTCGVHYDSDLKFVRDLVVKTIVERFDAVTSKQEVLFMYNEFADSSINFETRFWIKSTSALEVAKAKSEAIIAIKAEFDANDINIPFPIRTLDFPEGFLGGNTQNEVSAQRPSNE